MHFSASSLEVEVRRTNENALEIHSLQRQLAQKDLMIEEGRIALQIPTRDLEKLTLEHEKLTKECNTLSQKYWNLISRHVECVTSWKVSF